MPAFRILPFIIPDPDARYDRGPRFGPLQELAYLDRDLVFCQAINEIGVEYALVIGFRMGPKLVGEKPGDEIKIHVVPEELRPSVEARLRNLARGTFVYFDQVR